MMNEIQSSKRPHLLPAAQQTGADRSSQVVQIARSNLINKMEEPSRRKLGAVVVQEPLQNQEDLNSSNFTNGIRPEANLRRTVNLNNFNATREKKAQEENEKEHQEVDNLMSLMDSMNFD